MYPIDRRVVASHIYSKLHSLRKTALLLQVCHTTISRWLKNPSRLPRNSSSRSLKSEVIVECIKTSIKNDPLISVNKLQSLLSNSLAIKVSKELVRVAIKRLGYSRKKAKFYGHPKNLETQTKQFIEKRNKFIEDGRQFLSIDETSFGRNSFEDKGYSEIGKRLFIRKKIARITTTSVIACASSNGWVHKQATKGSNNAETFLKFLEALNLSTGLVILLDNVSFHHSKVIKDYLASKNVEVLYTPPYSPWFNPIELCFSSVKRQFRKEENIEKAFDSIPSFHFQNFFRKSLGCISAF